MTITVIFLVVIFGVVLAGVTLAGGLTLVRLAANVVHQAALDGIEVYSCLHTARLEADTGRAKLDYWQQYAEAALHERRQKLLRCGDENV